MGMATPDITVSPPHNLDAEQSVLGAILLSEKPMYGLVIEDGLKPDDFFRDQHRLVFGAILELYNRSESIDPVTVSEHLRQAGTLEEAGGEVGVHALAGAVPAAGHVRQYGRIVRENSLLRRLRATALDIQQSVAGREAEPYELVERAERSILEVAHDDRRKDFQSIDTVLHTELDKMHELSVHGTSLTGTPSGYEDLDAITGGFQKGNLVIIAARPSMGKSALVTNIAENASLKHGAAVGRFSLEMSESELAQRFVASQSSTFGDDLRKGRVKAERWPKILRATNELAQAPLYIDDSSDIGVLEIRAKSRRLHHQHAGGLGLIIIDYLQLMRADDRIENRVQQVGQISRGLKMLARELDVPVIALSQLNRGVEARTDKRPLLSDLRESGSVEQDADLVMFIYRDDYYNREDSEKPGIAEILISKHRNGGLGIVDLVFQSEYPRFMSYQSEE
jgi:replicative DNA helicase